MLAIVELQNDPVQHTSESDLRFKAIERWRWCRRTIAAQAVALLAEQCGRPIPDEPP